MDRIKVRGYTSRREGAAEVMRDMLRYDDGKIEAIWDYPKPGALTRFTAIVQLNTHTPDRWHSFGLATEFLGRVGEYSPLGYSVDEWKQEFSHGN